MKKALLILTISGTLLNNAKAQNEMDVLRYSQSNPTSTARSAAVGGAFGAVGADLSSASINPAGLGLFRSSQLTGSMALYSIRTNSTYIDNSISQSKMNFNIPNIGVVFTNVQTELGEDKKEGIVNYNIAFTLNRTNNFHQKYFFEGNNSRSSILHNYQEAANRSGIRASDILDLEPFELAWSNFLIDAPDSMDETKYISAIGNDSGYVLRQNNFSQYGGGMTELGFSGALNYSHWLYLGAGIALTTVRFSDNTLFTETDEENSVNFEIDTGVSYHSSTFRRRVVTEGSGVSGRFGAIVKPLDFFRVGIAIQTPTYFTLNDAYSYEVSHTTDQGDELSTSSPAQQFKYNISTPLKVTYSAAFVIAKSAFISMDYEAVNYRNASLNSDLTAFTNANRNISAFYRNTGNLRLGAEYKYDIFSIRAGYANYGSPFKSVNDRSKRQSFAGGFGISQGPVFFDMGVINTVWDEFYTPYTVSDPTKSFYTARNNVSAWNFVIGGGIKF